MRFLNIALPPPLEIACSSAEYACTLVPIARPRLDLAVEAEETSDRLFVFTKALARVAAALASDVAAAEAELAAAAALEAAEVALEAAAVALEAAFVAKVDAELAELLALVADVAADDALLLAFVA